MTVVAPILGPVLKEYLRAGRIAAHLRAYADGDLAGACLAIAATDEPAVNGAGAPSRRAPAACC